MSGTDGRIEDAKRRQAPTHTTQAKRDPKGF